MLLISLAGSSSEGSWSLFVSNKLEDASLITSLEVILACLLCVTINGREEETLPNFQSDSVSKIGSIRFSRA